MQVAQAVGRAFQVVRASMQAEADTVMSQRVSSAQAKPRMLAPSATLAASLDQGNGVDANMAMAHIEAGFSATYVAIWRQLSPSVLSIPHFSLGNCHT